ncbi:hypothetical protein FCL52_10220 [Micrococcus luteus]|nr:hypothetical protein FCL52_10220 [Micrococcus luteus]
MSTRLASGLVCGGCRTTLMRRSQASFGTTLIGASCSR